MSDPDKLFHIYSVRAVPGMAVEAPASMTITFNDVMFREHGERRPWLEKQRPHLIDRCLKKWGGDLQPVIIMAHTHDELWCPGWFSHWTFRDRFDSPEAVVNDFEAYVARVLKLQGDDQHAPPEHMKAWEKEHGQRWICLMGAQERWRWRGVDEHDIEASTPPPCRCKDCETAGVWRIVH